MNSPLYLTFFLLISDSDVLGLGFYVVIVPRLLYLIVSVPFTHLISGHTDTCNGHKLVF